MSDYIVEAIGEPEPRFGVPAVNKTFTVEGHSRRQSVFALLKTVFNKLGDK